MAMASAPLVTVFGSLNMDISVTVRSLPGPGATVLGTDAAFASGGKGSNQAVAAARLGGAVTMVGCVGDDTFGGQLLAALTAEGISVARVRKLPGVPTGIAMITVDADGENMITVASGANREVGGADVDSALAGRPDVLVVNAEIPAGAIAEALAGKDQATLGILNLAPAPEGAADIVAAGVDWLVVNETEASAVLGRQVAGLEEAAGAAQDLVCAGAASAVVTAGAEGAALACGAGSLVVPGFSVRAVDSVGAGDTFVGALAVALGAKVPPREALRLAAAAGAAAATRPGTQSGMPFPQDISKITGLDWPVNS